MKIYQMAMVIAVEDNVLESKLESIYKDFPLDGDLYISNCVVQSKLIKMIDYPDVSNEEGNNIDNVDEDECNKWIKKSQDKMERILKEM
jgi:hypothetical protein